MLLLGYLFGSLALGSGSYWHYLLAIAAATWGIKFMIRSMRK